MEEALCPIEQRFTTRREVVPEEGWMSSRFQQAETEGTAPLGAVIPKRPVPEASWARREAIINGRKLRRAFSDLFFPCMKCKAVCYSQAQPRKEDERTESFLRAHLRRALFCVSGHRPAQAQPRRQKSITIARVTGKRRALSAIQFSLPILRYRSYRVARRREMCTLSISFSDAASLFLSSFAISSGVLSPSGRISSAIPSR